MGAKSNAGRVRVGVWGATGSGKSSYVKRQLAKRKRVVIFDPQGEYDATQAQSVEAVRLEMMRNWSGFRIAYRPPPGKEAAALSALCKLITFAQTPFKKTGTGSALVLVVEEMNLSFPVSGGAAKCPGFAQICSRGRHYGVEVWGVSQRIAEVDKRFRGNCTETVVFRQKGARDQHAAALELGCSAAELPRANLTYIHERAGSIETGKITFRKNV
jgi:DNA helicase HerA-like ATPase